MLAILLEVLDMNHTLLKSVIYDQHEFIRNFQIVPRNYEFEENGNYVLVGLRRAGKSTLLYKIVLDLVASGVDWDQIIYINFEDERLSEFTVADFNDILSVQSELSDKKGYFFLDEVQNIDGWEKFARRMADSKEHIYITGSNARMLSREIETTLGGRFFAKHITPYTFGEYLTACEIPHNEPAMLGTKTNGKIRAACAQYLQYGGLPESLLYKAKREYISGVLGDKGIIAEEEELTPFDRASEYLMLGMRTAAGISREEYRSVYQSSFDKLEEMLEVFQENGWAVCDNGRWHFTPGGFLVSNVLIGVLLESQTKEKFNANPWIREAFEAKGQKVPLPTASEPYMN